MNADTLRTRAYDEFEQATLRLHELIRNGEDASEEAERLRDWLFDPWKTMTPEQRDFGNGLSSDLYMLNPTEGEVLEVVSQEERSPRRLGVAIKSAWDRHDYAGVLSLLRRGPEFFPPNHLAYLRARAYAELGRPRVALAFIRNAISLDPVNATYKVLEIHLLRALGREGEAIDLARRYIANANTPAKLIVYAAGVVFESTKGSSDADAQPTWRQLANILQTALGAAVVEGPSLTAAGCVTLGACYDALGENDAAIQTYRAALMLLRDLNEHVASAALQDYIRERFRPQLDPNASVSVESRNVKFALTSMLTETVGA